MEQDNTEKKWRFPDNGHLRWYGFDTPDMETFKKDPIAHFAREICQNSIDAHRNGNKKPVRIDFKTFDIHYSKIPNYSELKTEINYCRNYKASTTNEREQKTANSIFENICGDNLGHISCLRISDFNTTGLYGAKTHDLEQPFYSLAFGSGSSQKGSGSAGSKGIGKYAAFVISKTNTVFYSTHAIYPNSNKEEDAHIGISKLCSRPMDESDNTLATMGEGCYGVGEKNHPIMEQLQLDPSFKREKDEYGTDLYIIGFKEQKDWKDVVLKKVLDSFIVAIIKEKLEVNVDGTILDKNTLPKFIEKIKEQSYLSTTDKTIIAQYEILSNLKDKTVKQKTVSIKECDIDLYIKTYAKEQKKYATNKCSRIRFPYMKIDDIGINIYANASAMCIIENNYVNDFLRELENPQHTEWQKKRFRDEPEKYKEAKEILESLKNEIDIFVTENFVTTDTESTDLEGAGDYLPDDDTNEGDNEEGEATSANDMHIVSKPNRKKTHIKGVESQDGNGNPDSVHANGEQDDNGNMPGTKSPKRRKNNQPSPGPNPEPQKDPDPEDLIIYGKGFKPFQKQIISKNVRFRCIKPISSNLYEIVFTADSTNNDCEIQLSSVGDDNDTQKIAILSAKVNGKSAKAQCGRVVHIPISEGQKYKVTCEIDRTDVFASKVLMYAYKK